MTVRPEKKLEIYVTEVPCILYVHSDGETVSYIDSEGMPDANWGIQGRERSIMRGLLRWVAEQWEQRP